MANEKFKIGDMVRHKSGTGLTYEVISTAYDLGWITLREKLPFRGAEPWPCSNYDDYEVVDDDPTKHFNPFEGIDMDKLHKELDETANYLCTDDEQPNLSPILENFKQNALRIVINEVLEKEFKPMEYIVTKMSEASWVTKWYWRIRFRQAMKRLDKAVEDCKKLKEELESV